MNPFLQRIADRIDSFSDWSGRAISWLTLLMVLTTFVIVVLRYAFNLGWIAMQESVTFMHAAVFMLGAAYTLRHDGHVRVDIFYRGRSRRRRALVDLVGTLLLLLPTCVFVFWVSWDYVAASWSLFEGSREPGGLPGVFLLKTLIPVMAALLVLQGLAIALRSALTLAGIRHDAADEEHDAGS